MILGIDPGARRVGIAVADLETRFARPLEVVDRTSTDVLERVPALVAELEVTVVVVGRPVGLSGRAGPAVTAYAELVEALRARLPIPVEEFDERFTTTIADQGLKAAGGNRSARDSLRDAVAAQVMLQGYLDATRTAALDPESGSWP
ncbi:MAG TPA: Holliday junction resolvase RuvX [Actinomycetota bacterium]|nr:Holliday junction resolvase RuvX [Actinomycetota bacterium]